VRLSDLEARIRVGLENELPGPEAQNLLAPRPRRGWQPGVVPPDCRRSAVLLLLFPGALGGPALLLTKRHASLLNHAGQVALPGGAVEEGETLEAGALREAHEEVGLHAAGVRILGRLSPLHVPVSGFVLYPIVAACGERPVLHPTPGEVDRILEAPLELLADARSYSVELRSFRGSDYRVPFVEVEGEKVWGATAMVLAEFLSLIGSPPDPWGASVD
jgi:8-oxo-dGTP pyrophosphatase MutT (NUDIX family)